MVRRAPAIIAWLALAVVAIGIIPSSLRPSELLFERDLLDFFLPMKAIYSRTMSLGDVPWWEPWTLGGEPFFAALQSQVLYPPNLLFLGVRLPWSLSLSSSLHVAIAAAGTLLVARELGRSWSASLLAASTFAAGGLFVSLVNLHNQLCSLAWMPWAWLGAVAFARRGSRRALALWIVALALALLAGEPQLALLAGLSSAALHWCESSAGPARALRNTVLVASVVAAACAVQIVPFVELAMRSDRVDSTWSQEGRHGLALESLPALVIAPTPTRPAPAGTYVRSLYMGPVTLLLALGALAALTRRSRVTLVLGALAALSLVLALGTATPLGRALIEATPFLRFPVKYFAVAALAIPLLAAAGLDAVRDALIRQGGARMGFIGLAPWLVAVLTAGQLVMVHRALVPSLPFDALMEPSALHRLLMAQTAADGPRVHSTPLTLQRLETRALRVASGDLAGAMRERVELLEGGLPAYFSIHSTWGGVALTPLEQARLLTNRETPFGPSEAAALRAGFLIDTASRTLPLPLLPIEGGAARLYLLPGAPGDAASPEETRRWIGPAECVGPAGLAAPSSYPGWSEIEPGRWRFRPRGLLPLALLSACTWLALLGLAALPRRRPDVASEGPRL